ncbi:hypothetical protein PG993_013282 [Apiospora rasikravindrae]|uniref:Integral membrane protein n=1 Tax=Apiospora rasikravindrae TaxID=990691 RepID=A0ABR1RX66_9PEZI
MSNHTLNQALNDWASIKKPAFRAVVGTSFRLSVLSVFARVWIRFRTRRKLSADDYFLFFAAACLIVSTVLLYRLCDQLYLATAVQKDKTIVLELNLAELNDLIRNGMKDYSTFLILAWTTTFFVKFSFLAFFRELVHRVASIQYYYWFVVGLTVVSWMFLVAEPFILCPYFGAASCENLLYVSMTGLATGLDALSDILSKFVSKLPGFSLPRPLILSLTPVASIAIIVLHPAKIRTKQKISLGVFLCLNLFMVALAITRASKINGAAGVDVPWEVFWQFMEASVAVLMGSLTVFRTLLSSKTGSSENERRPGVAVAPGRQWPHARPAYYVFSSVGRRKRRAAADADLEATRNNGGLLPEVPGATMTGLRTFIRRNNRGGESTGNASAAQWTGVSQQETVVDPDENHQLMTHGLLKSNASHGSGARSYSQVQGVEGSSYTSIERGWQLGYDES